MTSRQQTSLRKSSKPYLINTGATKREIDSKSIHNMIETASGLEENPSPQFETIIKDRFLKALPAKVAACSGNWFYTDLIGLAKCATEYMKANKRYTRSGRVINPPIRYLSKYFLLFNRFC